MENGEDNFFPSSHSALLLDQFVCYMEPYPDCKRKVVECGK